MTSPAPEVKTKIKLAAVQAAPVFQNKAATTEKVCSLIQEAGKNGADVIGFPEGFIPGHPGWVEVLPLSAEPAPSLFLEQFKQSVEVPAPRTVTIGAACKEANIFAVIGINERRPNTTGTLFNTQLFFGRDGTLLHKHQKYVPTVGERFVHAPGQTGSEVSVTTDFGTLSGLICGENGNPLAQYSLSLDYPSRSRGVLAPAFRSWQ
jgi:nitrilase